MIRKPCSFGRKSNYYPDRSKNEERCTEMVADDQIYCQFHKQSALERIRTLDINKVATMRSLRWSGVRRVNHQ